MTESQINAIVQRLDRIDKRLDKLSDDSVTWKTLLGIVGTCTAVMATVVTVGNALWGG